MKRGLDVADQGQRCGNCRFYQDRSEAGDASQWGACRRYPPQWLTVEESTTADFAQTDPSEWCGEWNAGQ